MKNLLLTTTMAFALMTPSFASESTGEVITEHAHEHEEGHASGHSEMSETHVEYTKGKIKKISEKTGKVTIIHGPLVKLDMPAMTMVFRADKAMIAEMSVGQEIEFVADRVKGKLTVVELK